jgi:hypothetical protein
MAPDGLWTRGIKKGLAALDTQLGSRVSKARSCVTEAPADVQAATVRLYIAASAQLTTPGHGYSGDMTRHLAPRDGPCLVQQSDKTGQLHAADAVQDIICYF